MSEGATKHEPGEHIQVTVTAQTGGDVMFRIKPTTAMGKMFDAYHGRMGTKAGSTRFLYNGERLLPTNTPKELDMHDGDVIDAVLQQTGGE